MCESSGVTPKGNDPQVNYRMFKSLKAGQMMLSNYSQLKKNDVKSNRVRRFSNDGQENLYLIEKQYSESPTSQLDTESIDLVT